jgi:voltage-gated potassium channel
MNRRLRPLGYIPGELRSKAVSHLLAILVIVVAGTLVFALVDGQSLGSSFYFIVMVMTLIGAANPNSFAGELVGIVVAVLAVGVILSFMTQILGPAALTAYWEGHRVRKASRMKNHIVLCGYSDTARVLLNNLPKDQVLVVVRDKPTADALTEQGAAAIQGDYETGEVLRKAGVPESRAVIAASPEDSENAFICLTSKRIARGVPVYATVSSQENLEKLREVKADHIISPALLSAEAILKSLGAAPPSVV